ncbi:hypothetical protein QYF36_004151 [Acer negundo]|nr:hypothetical protein QYF36_004151 [Acer negundo]
MLLTPASDKISKPEVHCHLRTSIQYLDNRKSPEVLKCAWHRTAKKHRQGKAMFGVGARYVQEQAWCVQCLCTVPENKLGRRETSLVKRKQAWHVRVVFTMDNVGVLCVVLTA